MMIIDNKFNIGDTVFLKLDEEQKPRIVIMLYVMETAIRYLISNGKEETVHYHFELSSDKNINIFSSI